ncbi:hypothetical protein [Asanoa iriomotensis]|uniref:Membrane protein YmcC n=1 Tax=Asanoa iriomotensis TaxID=234613 RepID=A0ABQ4C6D3_9ACTN|nr:hypothetical protein [Asanoa iriomotensis]GIF58336.1 hypothetical protein Air01nite_44310 [Asanoa iriomotensis]
MIVALIVASEIGFWVLLGLGLLARYVLRMRRLSVVLLVGSPVLDLVLLVATVVDLRRGGTAGAMHGLAAIYLGFSVMFGHAMIRWADQRFAHRFAGGPPPWKPPSGGWARTRHEWREWFKAVLACGISAALLGAGILMVDDADRAAGLVAWLTRLPLVVAIWFVAGPGWATLFPGRPKEDAVR